MPTKQPVTHSFRGDRAGGPCAILDCREVATTAVDNRRGGTTVWYCEQDARATVRRYAQSGRGHEVWIRGTPNAAASTEVEAERAL